MTAVSVECKAHAGAMVTMLSGAPAGPPASSVQFQLNVTAEDNGHSFLCSAALEVAGEVLYKNKTLKLHVLCEWDRWTMTSNLQGPIPKTSRAPDLWGPPLCPPGWPPHWVPA